MSRTLNIPSSSIAERYVVWLSSLSEDVKLRIIEGLSVSLRGKKKRSDNDMMFVNKLSGTWNDGIPTEDKMREIRNEEHSLLQREVAQW